MESFSFVDVPIASANTLPRQRSSGGTKRSHAEDLDKDSEGVKRVKMRSLGSVLQLEGFRKCSKLTEAKPHGHHNKEDDSSQIIETAVHLLSDKPNQSNPGQPPEPNGICLSLGLVENSVQSPSNLISNVAPKQNEETSGPFFNTNVENEPDPHPTCSIGLALDLNEDIFHPYKTLGQVRSVDPSECGSTTGPVEESEPLKIWKEMKQNGFLSSSHGGIPIPKQRGRPAKRRKDDELKKNSELAKKEHANKYTKLAAPTGLLSGLNPGIIKHVRNSKQVNSIIEAMLQSEKREDQMQSMDQCENGSMGISAINSAGNQFNLYLNRTFPCTSESFLSGHSFFHENSTVSGVNSQYDDDSLALKLSSTVTMASEHATSASFDGFSANQDSLSSLSSKGASVASQWLDLLQQDIKGRLAALRRSKKRVRNAIQTELPYLLSREISSKQGNGAHCGDSSESGQPTAEIMNTHIARWKSIFSKMDKALHEEGKHLENWLKQVQDMQSHCERGLKHLCANNGLSQVSRLEELSGLKKTDVVEREHAVRAAAASMYSTCNFIMTKENVPCC